MDIVVKKDDLLKGLNHIQSVVERRNTVPILANIKFFVDENSLVISATDMDMCSMDKLKVQCNEPGSTTIPSQTLFEIVRKVPENCDISIKVKPGSDSALMVVGTSEFNIPVLPAEGFPNFEVSAATHTFKVHSEVLATLFGKTKHAISNEETRYYLNGSYFHIAESEEGIPVLRVVATDGHRLARAQTVAPDGSMNMPGIIVPKKAVNELVKLLEDYAGDVEIELSGNRATFNVGTSTLSTRIIDGKFPDYDRVIPKNNDKHLEISRDDLARSIDLVISVSNDKTRSVKFNIQQAKVVISASSDLNGSARGVQEIPANFDSQDPIVIGFNSKYVLDSLDSIDGSNVRISLSSDSGAVLATDVNEKDFLYLLMPMQG